MHTLYFCSPWLFSLLDLDGLGSETRDIILPDKDTAAHRYETIELSKAEDLKRQSKSQEEDEEEIVAKTHDEKSSSSINYGYHPIIDFFGNFRFEAA